LGTSNEKQWPEGHPRTSTSDDAGDEPKYTDYMCAGKEVKDTLAGSDTSDSYELDDSSDITLKLLLYYPSGNDVRFLQDHANDACIFEQR